MFNNNRDALELFILPYFLSVLDYMCMPSYLVYVALVIDTRPFCMPGNHCTN